MEFNEENYAKIELQTDSIFRQAGWKVDLVTNYERIDVVVERALVENVIRDTSTFFFHGFGAAITGMTSAFFGSATNLDIDYKA